MATGASRGIGGNTILQLTEEGYNVAVDYVGGRDEAETAVEEIKIKDVENSAI